MTLTFQLVKINRMLAKTLTFQLIKKFRKHEWKIENKNFMYALILSLFEYLGLLNMDPFSKGIEIKALQD